MIKKTKRHTHNRSGGRHAEFISWRVESRIDWATVGPYPATCSEIESWLVIDISSQLFTNIEACKMLEEYAECPVGRVHECLRVQKSLLIVVNELQHRIRHQIDIETPVLEPEIFALET